LLIKETESPVSAIGRPIDLLKVRDPNTDSSIQFKVTFSAVNTATGQLLLSNGTKQVQEEFPIEPLSEDLADNDFSIYAIKSKANGKYLSYNSSSYQLELVDSAATVQEQFCLISFQDRKGLWSVSSSAFVVALSSAQLSANNDITWQGKWKVNEEKEGTTFYIPHHQSYLKLPAVGSDTIGLGTEKSFWELQLLYPAKTQVVRLELSGQYLCYRKRRTLEMNQQAQNNEGEIFRLVSHENKKDLYSIVHKSEDFVAIKGSEGGPAFGRPFQEDTYWQIEEKGELRKFIAGPAAKQFAFAMKLNTEMKKEEIKSEKKEWTPSIGNITRDFVQKYSDKLVDKRVTGMEKGSIVLIQTNTLHGNLYGALEIQEYGSSLGLNYVTFKDDGTIKMMGSNIMLGSSCTFDPSIGRVGGDSDNNDVWWTGYGFTPQQKARLYLLPKAEYPPPPVKEEKKEEKKDEKKDEWKLIQVKKPLVEPIHSAVVVDHKSKNLTLFINSTKVFTTEKGWSVLSASTSLDFLGCGEPQIVLGGERLCRVANLRYFNQPLDEKLQS